MFPIVVLRSTTNEMVTAAAINKSTLSEPRTNSTSAVGSSGRVFLDVVGGVYFVGSSPRHRCSWWAGIKRNTLISYRLICTISCKKLNHPELYFLQVLYCYCIYFFFFLSFFSFFSFFPLYDGGSFGGSLLSRLLPTHLLQSNM